MEGEEGETEVMCTPERGSSLLPFPIGNEGAGEEDTEVEEDEDDEEDDPPD